MFIFRPPVHCTCRHSDRRARNRRYGYVVLLPVLPSIAYRYVNPFVILNLIQDLRTRCLLQLLLPSVAYRYARTRHPCLSRILLRRCCVVTAFCRIVVCSSFVIPDLIRYLSPRGRRSERSEPFPLLKIIEPCPCCIHKEKTGHCYPVLFVASFCLFCLLFSVRRL
jgi:hypothetical protein